MNGRRKFVRILLASACAVVLVLAGLTFHAPASGEEITLFFTATTTGHLEPCGCPVNPSGGLPRRAGYIRQHMPARGPVLLLEGGDFLGPPTPQGLLQSEYLFGAMQKMGYEVLGLGPRDFAFGIDYLHRVRRRYGFTFTNANVKDGRTGKLLFPPYAVTRVGQGRLLGIPFGGVTVGIISVIGPDAPLLCPTCDPPPEVLDPVESVTRVAPELRRKCDLLIVLASTDQKTLDRLTALPEVDVVIASRTLYVPEGYDNVGLRGHAVLAYTGYQARRIGYMHLVRGPDGRIKKVSGDLVSLGEDIPEDPEIARLIAGYTAEQAAHTREE